MIVRPHPLAILLLLGAVLIGGEPTRRRTVAERIGSREFPSVFQAWNPADNLKSEDRWTTLARHDLVFHAPDFFGLKWNSRFQGLATDFSHESQQAALRTRELLLDKNPNRIVLAELRYRDAHRSYLPDDHPWWQRKNGKRVIGWEEGGYYLLDFANTRHVEHVSRQARAIMASGVFDGIMLDWWVDDDDRLALVKAIRGAIGDDALMLVNANDRRTPMTAPFINGYFMECYRSKTVEDWGRIADTLEWAEQHLKEPRVNCLEIWFRDSRQDLSLMRAATTLSMTLSDGYCLFSDPNPLPTADHLHDWYPFWDRKIGRPRGNGSRQEDGSIRREFERGLVVYNPPGNQTVTVRFSAAHHSASTGAVASSFKITPGDGDLFWPESAR